MNKNKPHIKEFFDEFRFEDLTENQLVEIKTHIVGCDDCRRAFDSVKLASILLKENSAAEISVPPFFQAKVLNAWREKQVVQKPLAVFWRWWQASAALILLMFLTIIGLLTASVIGARSETAINRRQNSNQTLYSTETVILNQRPAKTLTTEQIYEVLDDR